eukprot:4199523-Pyramimonas_sp.AAC.1
MTPNNSRTENPSMTVNQLNPQKVLHRATRDDLYLDRLPETFKQRLLKWVPEHRNDVMSIERSEFREVMLPPCGGLL